MHVISIKRVYDQPSKDDGFRILVDRLWPRGLKKEKAGVDLWLKDVAPSDELRKWFSHDARRWIEFKNRYFTELDGKSEIVGRIYDADDNVTFLYGAKDDEHNNAVALREYILARIESGRRKV
ncbi:DUF488 domain-containing protein [archaeon]|nr:DUF488 domain-containing protein [archaeon]